MTVWNCTTFPGIDTTSCACGKPYIRNVALICGLLNTTQRKKIAQLNHLCTYQTISPPVNCPPIMHTYRLKTLGASLTPSNCTQFSVQNAWMVCGIIVAEALTNPVARASDWNSETLRESSALRSDPGSHSNPPWTDLMQ